MRISTTAIGMAAMLCIAAPASAGFKSWPQYGFAPSPRSPVMVDATPAPTVGRDLDQVRDRVRQMRKEGLISRGQARQLRREAGVIARHADLYSRDGLTDSEQDELEMRTQYLLDLVRPTQ